jgi:MATE family multidrug resistance protein
MPNEETVMATTRDAPGLAGQAWDISRLGAPLIGFFFIQNAASLASLAIVGRLGDAALAGVGGANAVFAVVLALLFGFDTGVQAISSRATGAGAGDRLGAVLTDGVAGSAMLGAVLAAATWWFGPRIMALILSDPTAVAAGSAFIQGLAASLLFLGVTIPINAMWIGSGRPGITFLITLLLAPVQIGLTVLLVQGAGPVPALGTVGAGLAGSLSTLAGIGLQLFFVLRLRPLEGFFSAPPRLAGIGAVATIGWPVSAQQSLLQLGFMGAFVIVAKLGTSPAAVANVLVSLTLLPMQSVTGLGIAAATLVGQTLGRGDEDEARRWGWRTSVVGVLLTAPLGLAVFLAPEPVLSLFLRDPSTLALAIWPAKVLGLGVGLDAVGRVLCYALRGAGATKWAAGVPFLSQWLIQLPLMWWVGVTLGLGILGVTFVQTGLAGLDGVILALVWAGRSWTRVRVGDGLSPQFAS